ncbi:MAG: hypothetical protein Q9220_004678 [cf. Caloplaca sp. 1 TL-2023]
MVKRVREEKPLVTPIEVVTDIATLPAKKRKLKASVTADGDGGEQKVSKEEGRELKRLKKQQSPENGVVQEPTVVKAKVDSQDIKDDAKGAAKAARKAERAQAKADKLHAANGTNGEYSKHDVSNSDSKAQRKADRKAEKQREKKLEQTEKSGTILGQTGSVKQNGNATTDSKYIEHSQLASLPEEEISSFLSSNHITINDPSVQRPLRPITKFSYLPPSSNSSALSAFKTPTPIQASAWPFLFSHRDVIGVAETGSGKTLAFGIPCIHSITTSSKTFTKPKSNPSSSISPARAVIISPTRELAVQIHSQMEQLAHLASLSTAVIYGGVPKDPQRLALQTAHIIIATPGRLNDLIEEGSVDLSQITYLVLDEADRMLETGFEHAIRTIISHIPSTSSGRQTLMFTATWPPTVRDLAATFMQNPVHITIGADTATGELRANTRIEQQIEVLQPYDKEMRMLQLLKQYQHGKSKNDRILVFALYKKEAARIENFLRGKGFRVAGIHGDLAQSARMAALEGFKNGSCPLLVATDVAARGLDIPNVKLVLNITFPLTVEDYVHRIGRTGRAGDSGLAVTFFTEHDKGQSGALINVLRAANQPVPEELLKFGTTVKKRGHEAYGNFYKDTDGAKTGTKIKFD